jgi:RNA polymerase sigma factor (sigma-70 family)
MMATFTHDPVFLDACDRLLQRGNSNPYLTRDDWDYAGTADAVLVVFARKINDQRAVQELLARHYSWLRGVIGRRARRAGLRREDTEDAQQEAVFALTEAVFDYDLLESARHGGCSFRTFLGRRAVSRFANQMRRLRWLEQHRRGEVELVVALDGRTLRLGSNASGPGWQALERSDPAAAAQWRELYELLRQAIVRFDEQERRILEQTAAGVPLEQQAQQLGVARSTLLRRKDRLRHELTEQFRDWLE